MTLITQKHTHHPRIAHGGTATVTASLIGCPTGDESGMILKVSHGSTEDLWVEEIMAEVAVADTVHEAEDTAPPNFFCDCIRLSSDPFLE